MGKKLVIIGFVLSFGLALYLFWSRDKKRLRDNLKEGEREPRVVLENFVVFRFDENKIKSRLTAHIGHFYEPNLVELDGEIRGERLTASGRESVGAESMLAYLNSTSLSKLMGDKAQVERAEFSGFVEVGVKDHMLTTDYAEYLNDTQMVRSSRPVRVEGKNRVFSGDEGFSYSIDKEVLQMPGIIKGVVQLEGQ